ncbi:gag-pol polyprotein [Trifolium medium]|uniref:Gag-pol polyprotein n=1 Tax=Trifolium medium TaxID=97028 RepID=A0A392NY71_9FABA|nr:gag-pol polyprotein [Trifolium medium]
MDTDESNSEAIVILGRQFNKVLKRMDQRPRTNAEYISQDISRNNNFQRNTKTDEKSNQGKVVQCHEYEGYESEEEVDSETAKHIKVLTGICMSDEESCDGVLTYDELANSYKELSQE